jgi:hypothetical protein
MIRTLDFPSNPWRNFRVKVSSPRNPTVTDVPGDPDVQDVAGYG